MNLLAHALLSGAEPGVIAGGVMADWIKGPLDELRPPILVEGIRRHRQVDTYTDAHPVTAVSRARIQGRWGRYSGILVDMAYDVCLAATWNRFGSGTLEGFVRGVYAALEPFISGLPGRAPEVARVMIDQDWLQSYGRWDGVEAALERVCRRLKRPVPLVDAVDDLRRLEPQLAADFGEFFPQLQRHVGPRNSNENDSGG